MRNPNLDDEMIENIKTATSGQIGAQIAEVRKGERADVDRDLQALLINTIIAQRLGEMIEKSQKGYALMP